MALREQWAVLLGAGMGEVRPPLFKRRILDPWQYFLSISVYVKKEVFFLQLEELP